MPQSSQNKENGPETNDIQIKASWKISLT